MYKKLLEPRSGEVPTRRPEFADELMQWVRLLHPSEVRWIQQELSKLRPNEDGAREDTKSALNIKPFFAKQRTKKEDGPSARNLQMGSSEKDAEINASTPLITPAHTSVAVSKQDDELDDKVPVVQFANFQFYGKETEPEVPLTVMRIGDCRGTTVVRYESHDLSARAGVSYEKVSGTLVFQPGEITKTIVAKLLPGYWRPTEVFDVDLLPEGLQGATLGAYLKTARVFRLDEDLFPSSACGRDDISSNELLLAYMRLCWKIPIVRLRTIKLIVSDQLRSVFELCSLILQVYLVDHVLPSDGDLMYLSDRLSALFLVSAVTVVVFLCEHLLDYAQLSIGVGGALRMSLQSALVRKYLNYSEDSRVLTSEADLLMAITRDVPEVVSHGYGFIFELFKALGSIVVAILFLFSSPYIFNAKERLDSEEILCRVSVLIGIPALLAIPLLLREGINHEHLTRENKAMTDIADSATEIADNIDLIRDYSVREKGVQRFEAVVKAYNKEHSAKNKTMLNSTYCAPWLSIVVVALFIPFRGHMVVLGTVSVGMFLANMRLISSYGKAWGDIYKLFLRRQSVIPAFRKTMWLLNLSTDGPGRMELMRRLTEDTQQHSMRCDPEDSSKIFDTETIKCVDLSHTYTSKTRPPVEIKFTGRLEIPQGTLVGLFGHMGEGKATVLRLLAKNILPDLRHLDNSVAVFAFPSHLRTVHVSSTPVFHLGSLYSNLTYGVREGHPDANWERVRAICGLVGLSDYFDMADKHDSPLWFQSVSEIEARLLSVVRVLVANPEVICLQKPLSGLSTEMQMTILDILKTEYVREKGVKVESTQKDQRRPRTCIFTSGHYMFNAFDLVDLCYDVSKDMGFVGLNRDNFQRATTRSEM